MSKFAAIQAPLGVIRVADGAAGALGEYLIRGTWNYLEDFIHHRVAKHQEPVVGPHRSFSKVEIGDHALDFQVAELLGEHAGCEQQSEKNSHLSRNYSGREATHRNCGDTGPENLSCRRESRRLPA